MTTRYTLAAGVTVDEFVAMAEAIDEDESLILPFVGDNPYDELAARRRDRSSEPPTMELIEFVNVKIDRHEPFVVHADMKHDNQLTWVHIQVDGNTVSFILDDFWQTHE